jgi:hypothetical protein
VDRSLAVDLGEGSRAHWSDSLSMVRGSHRKGLAGAGIDFVVGVVEGGSLGRRELAVSRRELAVSRRELAVVEVLDHSY